MWRKNVTKCNINVTSWQTSHHSIVTTVITIIVMIIANLMRRELPLSSFESLLQSQDGICTHRVLVGSLNSRDWNIRKSSNFLNMSLKYNLSKGTWKSARSFTRFLLGGKSPAASQRSSQPRSWFSLIKDTYDSYLMHNY